MQHTTEMEAFVLDKTKSNIEKYGDQLPAHTVQGKYEFTPNGFWTGGFWTGMNWLNYEISGDEQFVEAARASSRRFTDRLYQHPETLDHDIGFLYIPSFVADYKITGSKEARQIALDAADRLKERYNPEGRFIQAWNVWKKGEPFSEENRGRIIIDCMYNLPILFWATEETGDESFKQVAIAHAETCMNTIIRPDYTAFHTYVFDPVSGKPKYGRTFQGYADESCWSRGQTWAIGGYAYAYAYTGKQEFLEVARKCAEVYLNRLEGDLVPPWDFDVPDRSTAKKDTSAAAIAAASLLELAEHVDGDERDRYLTYVHEVMDELYLNYSTREMPDDEGLILHACGHHPNNSHIDCSLIYGDYYFIEALARLQGKSKGYWR